MQTLNADNNTIEILIIVFGAIFLILWLVWVIRLAAANGRIRSKNRRILDQSARLEKALGEADDSAELIRTQAEQIDGLKAKLNPSGSATSVVEAPRPTERQQWRTLSKAIINRKIYLREKVTKDELAEILKTDKKGLDSMAAAVLPSGKTVFDWIDGQRIKAAISLLRGYKNRKSGEDEDETIGDVAKKAGFSGESSLNKAVKNQLGMSLKELYRII